MDAELHPKNINHIYLPLKVLLQTIKLLNEETSVRECNESLNILNVFSFGHIKDFTFK